VVINYEQDRAVEYDLTGVEIETRPQAHRVVEVEVEFGEFHEGSANN
jgi:hypothetical protein